MAAYDLMVLDFGEYFSGRNQPAPQLTLALPSRLGGEHQAAIFAHVVRLNKAIADRDIPLVIGSAKELVESVARVVLDVRGELLPSSTDFPKVISTAHRLLERQPGSLLSDDRGLRDIASAAQKIAHALPELRNSYGTGHGRPHTIEVQVEIVLVTLDAAFLWVRWALRRLDFVLIGQPDALVRTLTEGKSFSRGSLGEWFKAFGGLGGLTSENQRLVGVAVAHRALTGTFVVAEDGVEACARSDDLDSWPSGYRIGLMTGLLIDRNGFIDADTWSVGEVANLLRSTRSAHDEFQKLAAQIQTTPYAVGFFSRDENQNMTKIWLNAPNDQTIPEAVRVSWTLLIERLGEPF